MTRTAERLAVVNTTLVDEGEAVSREMIERFAGCGIGRASCRERVC